jgi:hypothetical protein
MDHALLAAMPVTNAPLTYAPIKPSRADIMENLNHDIFVNVWGYDLEMLYGLKPRPKVAYDDAARVLLVDGRFDILERMLSARIVDFASLMNFAFESKHEIDGSRYVYWPYKNKQRLMTKDESKMRIDWVLARAM